LGKPVLERLNQCGF